MWKHENTGPVIRLGYYWILISIILNESSVDDFVHKVCWLFRYGIFTICVKFVSIISIDLAKSICLHIDRLKWRSLITAVVV